jgi:2-oxoisovalerate dehydrogenase E2 component (dihydrolipoyl transacylase)
MMRKEFILPDIGEGVVECEVVEWLVQEGQIIKEDDPVVDVMTDKALVQIPAPFDGKVSRLYYQKGEIAKVHKPLFEVELLEEKKASNNSGIQKLEIDGIPNEEDLTEEEFLKHVKDMPLTEQEEVTYELSQAVGDSSHSTLASPAVRRLARSYDVDLSLVEGSGKNGRVYKEDIESYKEKQDKPIALDTHVDQVIPLRGIQAKMAQTMAQAVATIPHFTYCDEFDLTELVQWREKIRQQQPLSLMPIFMKSLSLTLLKFPMLNSKLNKAVTELTYLAHHHIGFALDSKIGLIVPNVKYCQHKSMVEISDEMEKLIEQGREGRIDAEDLKHGTITISNIGSIGGTVATPIIHQDQMAIVALGKIQQLPRFDSQDNLVKRHIMQVSWSADHRVIDGATMAKFCNAWKKTLECPESMFLQMR